MPELRRRLSGELIHISNDNRLPRNPRRTYFECDVDVKDHSDWENDPFIHFRVYDQNARALRGRSKVRVYWSTSSWARVLFVGVSSVIVKIQGHVHEFWTEEDLEAHEAEIASIFEDLKLSNI
jgi:hypothetical protein